MVDVYIVAVFIHLLAFVFWLGADIGVFILGKFAQSPAHSPEQRLLLLRVAMIIDKFPRVSMVVSFASGFYLSLAARWLTLPRWAIVAVAAVFVAWFVATLARVRAEHPPAWVERVEKFVFLTWLAAIAGLVAATFAGARIVGPDWLLAKVVLVAVILLLVLWLERAFRPAVAGFMALAERGSDDAVETQIRTGMDATYRSVIGIYACTLAAAFFGVSKLSFG